MVEYQERKPGEAKSIDVADKPFCKFLETLTTGVLLYLKFDIPSSR
jgi:hypothetical protein